MNPVILKQLSLLNSAFSKEYASYITLVVESEIHKSHRAQILNIYAAYCYLIKGGNYNGFSILNDSYALNLHFNLLVGYIYAVEHIKIPRQYDFCRQLKSLFRYIANDKQLVLYDVQLSTQKISEDALNCKVQFQQLNIDKTRYSYLNGWQVRSKEGKKQEVNLDALYVQFGKDFTNKIHQTLINYALKQKYTSLSGIVKNFKILFDGMVIVSNEKNSLFIEASLDRDHVQSFFHKIYKVLFTRSQVSLHCPKNFHKTWDYIVGQYRGCFIDTGVFDKPNKPFIIPVWKDSKGKTIAFTVGGSAKRTEKKRWFANIPLNIKDEEAVSIIHKRLDRDMAHIKHVCCVKFNELLDRELRNLEYIRIGQIKPVNVTFGNRKYDHFLGVEKLENTVSTFYTHGIRDSTYYPRYLGFGSQTKELTIELNLPTSATLNVLLTLLIIEHPLITPSWLAEWELFNTFGNQVGFKQIGNKYLAVSYKARKRVNNAQQDIILNDFSKTIVEFLIQHTRMAREYLKQKGDPNWRKMLLTATPSSAVCLKKLNTNLSASSDFYRWLQDTSFFDEKMNITKEDAQVISDIHSLRSIRRHRGLQIYLKTRSLDAVSEALGHKNKQVQLLTYYLPEPLMDFFNMRWIRQFQSAILLEAMKDSVYRFEAVNMSLGEIEEFLNNHGISDISNHYKDNYKQEENKIHSNFNGLVYTISTSLLQLLIAIRFIIENDEESIFHDIVKHWYQSAVFVLTTLKSGKHDGDTELIEMLNEAYNNKLDTNIIKGVLLC